MPKITIPLSRDQTEGWFIISINRIGRLISKTSDCKWCFSAWKVGSRRRGKIWNTRLFLFHSTENRHVPVVCLIIQERHKCGKPRRGIEIWWWQASCHGSSTSQGVEQSVRSYNTEDLISVLEPVTPVVFAVGFMPFNSSVLINRIRWSSLKFQWQEQWTHNLQLTSHFFNELPQRTVSQD